MDIEALLEISTLIPIILPTIKEFFPGLKHSYVFVLRIWAQLWAPPLPSPSNSLIPQYKLPVGQAPGS